MNRFLQRDIVLVPFPFSEQSGAKKRPVLVVSNDKINSNNRCYDFIGIAITSRIRGGRYRVEINKGDTATGFLPKISEINCDKIASIPKKFVIKKICSLNNVKYTSVKSILKQIFNIG